jgi:large subunit ribosomal protein L35
MRGEVYMPKMKSKRGAAKRFRQTATGYKHRSANRNHLLTKKSAKRKRHLGGLQAVDESDLVRMPRMLPYGGGR